MSVPQQVLGVVTERLHERSTVKSVYGDAVTVDGRTVIPIATVVSGFGGVGGTGPKGGAGEQRALDFGHAGGGGGALLVKPKGYIEVTGRHSRYVPLRGDGPLLAAVAAGFALGAWFARKRKS